MTSQSPTWTYRALSVLLTSIVCFGLTEGAFRLLVTVSDVPRWAPDPRLGYRHEPRVSGIFASRSHAARFRLNNRGWNSPVDYVSERRPGVVRIAIVGDSYVEALQVDVGRGLGPGLERMLAGEGWDAEVYTYGISGASTAYAFKLLRAEIVNDRPDVIVYLFINNDVGDSVPFIAAEESPGPRFTLDPDGVLREAPLAMYHRSRWRRICSHSALFRYFWINRRLGILWHDKGWTRRIGAREEEREKRAPDEEPPRWQRAWEITGRLIAGMDALARRAGAVFIVVNQPHPGNYYVVEGHTSINRPVQHLTLLARKHEFRFVDLRRWFAEDWERHHERFDYVDDLHWSERGHLVAARALKEILVAGRPSLLGSHLRQGPR